MAMAPRRPICRRPSMRWSPSPLRKHWMRAEGLGGVAALVRRGGRAGRRGRRRGAGRTGRGPGAAARRGQTRNARRRVEKPLRDAVQAAEARIAESGARRAQRHRGARRPGHLRRLHPGPGSRAGSPRQRAQSELRRGFTRVGTALRGAGGALVIEIAMSFASLGVHPALLRSIPTPRFGYALQLLGRGAPGRRANAEHWREDNRDGTWAVRYSRLLQPSATVASHPCVRRLAYLFLPNTRPSSFNPSSPAGIHSGLVKRANWAALLRVEPGRRASTGGSTGKAACGSPWYQ